MFNWTSVYCIERDDEGRLYKRTRFSDKRFKLFPMDTAYIIYDSHDNWIAANLMYEPVARGLEGGRAKAEQVALDIQPSIKRFVYENPKYITRGGIVVTEKKDVYLIK